MLRLIFVEKIYDLVIFVMSRPFADILIIFNRFSIF